MITWLLLLLCGGVLSLPLVFEEASKDDLSLCCSIIRLSGLEGTAQEERMGVFEAHPHLYASALYYKHRTTNDELFRFNTDRWVIGPELGKDKAGIFFFNGMTCPHSKQSQEIQVEAWDGAVFQQAVMRIDCVEDEGGEKWASDNDPDLDFGRLAAVLDPKSEGSIDSDRLSQVAEITVDEADRAIQTSGARRGMEGEVNPTELVTTFDREHVGAICVKDLAAGLFLTHGERSKISDFIARAKGRPVVVVEQQQNTEGISQGDKSSAIPMARVVAVLDPSGKGVISRQDCKELGLNDEEANNLVDEFDEGMEGEAQMSQITDSLDPQATGEVTAEKLKEVIFAGNPKKTENFVAKCNQEPQQTNNIDEAQQEDQELPDEVGVVYLLFALDENNKGVIEPSVLQSKMHLSREEADAVIKKLEGDKTLPTERLLKALGVNPNDKEFGEPKGAVKAGAISHVILSDRENASEESRQIITELISWYQLQAIPVPELVSLIDTEGTGITDRSALMTLFDIPKEHEDVLDGVLGRAGAVDDEVDVDTLVATLDAADPPGYVTLPELFAGMFGYWEKENPELHVSVERIKKLLHTKSRDLVEQAKQKKSNDDTETENDS